MIHTILGLQTQAAAEAHALRRAKARDQGRALHHVRLEPWDRHYYTAQAQVRLHGGQQVGKKVLVSYIHSGEYVCIYILLSRCLIGKCRSEIYILRISCLLG